MMEEVKESLNENLKNGGELSLLHFIKIEEPYQALNYLMSKSKFNYTMKITSSLEMKKGA